MGEFLMAIWADRNTCKPYTGPGRVGHVVRVTDMPHPTVINEFTDGGSFEHSDCAPASFQSWLLDCTTTRTTIKEIEQLAGTGPNGTGWKGIEVAGLHFGYQIHFVTEDPLPGYVMNPGGGYIDPPSGFPDYLAATQGGCLVLPNVGHPTPTPDPAPTPEDDVKPILATTQRTSGQGPDPHGAGAVYLVNDWPYGPKRWITNPAYLAPYEALCGPIQHVDPFVLDRCEEGPHIDTTASPQEP